MAPKRPSLSETMKSVQSAPAQAAPAVAPAEPLAKAITTPAPPAEEGRGYFAATRADKKRVTAVVPPKDHRRLKRLSADSGETIEQLMLEAISDLFTKYGV